MRFTTYSKYRGRLADALNLGALLESGQLSPDMIRELRGEVEGDEEVRSRLAALLDARHRPGQVGPCHTNTAGLDGHILKWTFREVAACRKAGILINTFMLARDPHLVEFVRKVSEIARGKAYFTSTLTLGHYIMMDFLKRKRRRMA